MKPTNQQIEEKLREAILGTTTSLETGMAVNNLNSFREGQHREAYEEERQAELAKNEPSKGVLFPASFDAPGPVLLTASGPQGQGKSFILNILTGLLRESGHEVSTMPQAHRIAVTLKRNS